jgi:hypothetical protein
MIIDRFKNIACDVINALYEEEYENMPAKLIKVGRKNKEIKSQNRLKNDLHTDNFKSKHSR